MPRGRRKKPAELDAALNNVDEILTTPDVEPDSADADVQVDVSPPKRKSIADRLKATFLGSGDDSSDEVEEKQPRMSAKTSTELATQIAVFLAVIVCWCFEAFFRSPYEPVAPTQDESQAITAPIGRIIARRLKKAGRANPDTVDMVMSFTALTFYAYRARKTQREIYLRVMAELRENQGYAGNPSTLTSETSSLAASQNFQRGNQQAAIRYGQNAVSPDYEADRNGHQRDTGGGLNLDDELLRADAIGRAERGLQ